MNTEHNPKFFKNPLNLIIALTCLIVAIYFGVLIYKQIKPKTYDEKRMECLKLGSNQRAAECLRLIKNGL